MALCGIAKKMNIRLASLCVRLLEGAAIPAVPANPDAALLLSSLPSYIFGFQNVVAVGRALRPSSKLPILPASSTALAGRIRGSWHPLREGMARMFQGKEGKNQVKMKKQSHDFEKSFEKTPMVLYFYTCFFSAAAMQADSGSSIPQANARLYYSERLFPPG